MSKENHSIRRRVLGVGYLGLIMLLLACSFLTGVQQNDEGTMQMDDGVIQVQDENGDWVTVAGEATFELTGELESLDPWVVAGTTLETNDTTQIDENLQVGDLVHVQGTVLEDDTWVAYSIQLAEEETDQTLVLIGVVTSIDPWVVNGIELNVTDETDIQGDITEGMIVRVEILLLEDGTWEVLSIAPLGDSEEVSGCTTVIATVVSVDGDQIQFLGWPITITFEQVSPTETVEPNDNGGDEDNQGDDEDEGEEDENRKVIQIGLDDLEEGQVVAAVICVSEDGTFVSGGCNLCF